MFFWIRDIMIVVKNMNQERFLEFRKQYPNFFFKQYEIEECEEYFELRYWFSIPHLADFHPNLKIYKEQVKNKNQEYLEYLTYQIGLIELLSYWKCTCSPNIYIECGSLTKEQKDWFLKLYYWGLGEFRYVNGIDSEMENWVVIHAEEKERIVPVDFQGTGNLVAIGGGKDSAVSLEILKNEDNTCFMINPKVPGIECMKEAHYHSYLKVERKIDSRLLELNQEGYLNGHTPFSALVAFVSYLCAYMTNRKYIILSNEGSANEATVLGTNINHQYSKTYEFEDDFNRYASQYLKADIHYFSMLRCLNELQIAMLFSHYKQYHSIFKSCNVGSKEVPWRWCCNCPKCLFVFIILSPFLKSEELIEIFGENLYEKESLLPTFLELLGYKDTKPFECVGTYEEVRFAVSIALEKGMKGFLLEYYQKHYPLEKEIDYRKSFNEEHHIPDFYLNLVKEELKKYVS